MTILKAIMQKMMSLDIALPCSAFLLGIFMASLFWRFIWWKRKRSAFQARSRAVVKGLISEQLAPLLPGFKYNLSDARFIGNPIDFVVFNGLHENNIREIVFLEVKSTHRTALTSSERQVKDLVRNKNVKWETYRPDV